MLKKRLPILALAIGSAGAAWGQGLFPSGQSGPPIVRGSVGLRVEPDVTLFNAPPGSAPKIHLGPSGKACVTVTGYAKPQTINPKILNHVISAVNDCSGTINLQVCYFKSQSCIRLGVPGYGRKEALLGTLPNVKDFKFEYRESFF